MMTIASRLAFKTAVSTGLMSVFLLATVGCTTTPSYNHTPVYNGKPVYQDKTLGHTRQALRQQLRRSGYNVMDIRTDDYRGNQILVVHAKKNKQGYTLKYTYPELRLISTDRSDWSNGKKDKKYKYKENGKHHKSKDKHHYK